MTFREPKKITDLAEYAGEYIEYMRTTPDNSVCVALTDYANCFFTDVLVTDRQLQGLVMMFVDRIYRYAAYVTVVDDPVRRYFDKVTRYVLDIAAGRGARIFYILDNELRQDRFDLTMHLMFLSGVSVVTPYKVDETVLQFSEVRRALEVEILAGRHVAYIEKDASVNYVRLVVEMARSTDRHIVFRNLAPTTPDVQVLENTTHKWTN